MTTPNEKELTIEEMIKQFDEKYPDANITFIIDSRITAEDLRDYQGR